MRNKWLYNAFIAGFVVLYLATALISMCHAVEFFGIGNVRWMAVTLASVFEVGQMVVLSSILLSDNRKTAVPWFLLVILTFVQVVGNVYSVFKYITLSGSDYYVYLQKPLIDWWLSGVSQETIVVIISWIIGALLPIIALFMTSMVANNIRLRRGDVPTEGVGVAENGPAEPEPEKPAITEPVENRDVVKEKPVVDKPVENQGVKKESPVVDKPVENQGVKKETPKPVANDKKQSNGTASSLPLIA